MAIFMQGKSLVVSKPLERDSSANRALVIGYVEEIKQWRKNGEKFGYRLISASSNYTVGELAREKFNAMSCQKGKTKVFIDDTAIFDDRDLPPADILQDDPVMFSSNPAVFC